MSKKTTGKTVKKTSKKPAAKASKVSKADVAMDAYVSCWAGGKACACPLCGKNHHPTALCEPCPICHK